MNWSISASIRQHWRFANGLLVIVLLATGLLHSFWVRGYPHTDEGYDSGELWLFAAACLAVIPLLLKTLKTQWSDGTDAFSELLVAVAVLGALVSGEFVAAAIVPIILSIGHFLEQRSITGSQSAIDGLKRLRATTATPGRIEKYMFPFVSVVNCLRRT